MRAGKYNEKVYTLIITDNTYENAYSSFKTLDFFIKFSVYIFCIKTESCYFLSKEKASDFCSSSQIMTEKFLSMTSDEKPTKLSVYRVRISKMLGRNICIYPRNPCGNVVVGSGARFIEIYRVQ